MDTRLKYAPHLKTHHEKILQCCLHFMNLFNSACPNKHETKNHSFVSWLTMFFSRFNSSIVKWFDYVDRFSRMNEEKSRKRGISHPTSNKSSRRASRPEILDIETLFFFALGFIFLSCFILFLSLCFFFGFFLCNNKIQLNGKQETWSNAILKHYWRDEWENKSNNNRLQNFNEKSNMYRIIYCHLILSLSTRDFQFT